MGPNFHWRWFLSTLRYQPDTSSWISLLSLSQVLCKVDGNLCCIYGKPTLFPWIQLSCKVQIFFMFFLFFITSHLQQMSHIFKLILKLRTSCMLNCGCKQERFPKKISQCSTPWYMWVAGWPSGNSERCFVYDI